MCDEAVDNFLRTLNFNPDWFITNKMIKNLFIAFYADENILYFDKDIGNAIFSYNEMGILNIELNCINLDDNNFNEDDCSAIIHVRLLAWRTKFEKCKALEKELNEELMPVGWYPNR